MPVYPVARGESRLYSHRIEKLVCLDEHVVVNGSASEADFLRVNNCVKSCWRLRRYLVRNHISERRIQLVDCYTAPLLWRLPQLGIGIQRRRGERAERLYDPRLLNVVNSRLL